MGENQRRVLHILSPLSTETAASLRAGAETTAGDLIADLRGFPLAVYAVNEEGYSDITGTLPSVPDAWTTAREWLAGFTARTGLQDILSIDGYGFWWTLNGQRFVAGLTELGNVLAWIDLLLALRESVSLQSVSVHGQHQATLLVVKQVWRELAVEVVSKVAAGKAQDSSLDRTAAVPRRVGLLVVRLIIGVLYLVYSWVRRPEVCIFTDTNLIRSAGVGRERRQRDVYLGDVAKALTARGLRVAVIEKYGSNATWSGLRARGWFFPSDLVFFLAAVRSMTPGISRRLVRKWQGRWRELKPTLVSQLRYRGVDIASLVLPLLAQEFTSHAPNLEALVSIWRALLRCWRPSLLYVNNAYGRGSVPAIIAAKRLDIPTIEQQHGLIGRNHIAYLVPRHLELKTEFPLCDMMAVWGDFTHRFLVNAGVYQPERAVVCGFPRADLLLGQLPSRRETRVRLAIPTESTVVLYTSNAFAQDAMPDIVDGIQRVRQGTRPVHWLIKLHPRELTRQHWEAALVERGLRDAQPPVVQVVESDIDFYALLAACDIHVSFASTTLIEAAILRKPNLGLDMGSTSDPAGYRAAHAFLPVAPADLGGVVHELLSDPRRRKRLQAEQRAFAEDWCLHDGQAVERIVALVESVIGECGRRRADLDGPLGARLQHPGRIQRRGRGRDSDDAGRAEVADQAQTAGGVDVGNGAHGAGQIQETEKES